MPVSKREEVSSAYVVVHSATQGESSRADLQSYGPTLAIRRWRPTSSLMRALFFHSSSKPI